MAPSDTDDPALNEFLIAFARAILEWQLVEYTLFICFYRLRRAVGAGGDLESAGAAFYAAPLFREKLKVVDGICKAALSKAEMVKWQKLKRVLRNGATNRNALAHLTIQSERRIDGPTTYTLAPPLSVPLSIQVPRKRLDTKECDRLCAAFKAIGLRVSAFCAP